MRVFCLLRVRLLRLQRITSASGKMTGKDLGQHSRIRGLIMGVLLLRVTNRVVMRGNCPNVTSVDAIIKGTATVTVVIAASELGILLKIVGLHFHRLRPRLLTQLRLLRGLQEDKDATTVVTLGITRRIAQN